MKLETPLIIVNFKTYAEAIGKRAEQLAEVCERVHIATQKNIAIAVSPADLFRISRKVGIPVLSQHMDPDEQGSHTGSIIAESIRESGAIGTLLNHSEDRYRIDRLEAAIERARQAGLVSVVCANSDELAQAIAAFSPDFIAVEPPELIGGNISVSTAKPEIIVQTVQKVHKVADIPVLCGAGVRTGEDVRKAMELGAAGILLASGVALAKDPEKALRELADAL